LISAGVRLRRESDYYGLALPLGGGEVTMEELVRLYAMLANGGRLRPLCRTLPARMEPGARVLSPEAAFLALEMLGQVPRPDLAQPADDDGIYWKTGTSHGYRDAWSAAVFDHYVLAVWLGNFDGTRNPGPGRPHVCGAPPLSDDRCDAGPRRHASGTASPARWRQPARSGILRGFPVSSRAQCAPIR
jgi:membrane carboxypeptidase/penicillin-binding protein PbpC